MNTWMLAGLICFVAAMVLLGQLNTARTIDSQMRYLDGRIRMSQQEVIDGIVAQLAKAKNELAEKLEAATLGVQAQLVEAGVVEQVDLSALAGIAQALDDLVPDAVAEVEDADEEEAEAVDEAVEVDEADEEEAEPVDSVEGEPVDVSDEDK
jgi:hypothetical protein